MIGKSFRSMKIRRVNITCRSKHMRNESKPSKVQHARKSTVQGAFTQPEARVSSTQ
jgi:hypothetical protein